MTAENGEELIRWKWIAAGAFALACILPMLTAFLLRSARLTDERLIGTWQSDAGRTIAVMREGRPFDAKQEAALRTILGKLRITYSRDGDYQTVMDGSTDAGRYELLGRDKLSVVVRAFGGKPGILDLSEFSVVHFDGPDSYWVQPEVANLREYFRRVQ